MNKRIANPFIVNIMPKAENAAITQDGRRMYLPVNAPWEDFTAAIEAGAKNEAYDSVIVHIANTVDMDETGTVNKISIKINSICKAASSVDKAVLSDASKDVWYLMNPSWTEQQKAPGFAPSDEAILNKFHSYGGEAAWQEHQAGIWSRFADMMPLSAKNAYGTPNHLGQLTDPKRGLAKKDLDGFWSFKSNKMLTPALMGDDMVGMPSVDARSYDGFSLVKSDGTVQPLAVRSLKTVGISGIAIPMANIDGNVPKYQIATDPSPINVVLRARAADGISISKSEYFNKRTGIYSFKLADGTETKLSVSKVDNTGAITFKDAKGTFTAHMKENVFDTLTERGYALPPLIASLTVEPAAKYIWQSRGTMTGSEDVCKTVSPSNAGFIKARGPKTEADGYVVLVAEGALKGHIVAKHINVEDADGKVFGDHIAGNKGIIVAQVPGVSRAFVESVAPVYEKYDVKGTYIAMDADGRENLAVAEGIDTAYECLSQYSRVAVMSWNPEHKGLDDALLAVSRKEITIHDMEIKSGTPQRLFPKDKAKAPNPYHLDGTRANKQAWREEHAESVTANNQKLSAMQEQTQRSEDPRVKAIQEELVRKAAELRRMAERVKGRKNLQKNLETRAAVIEAAGKALCGSLPNTSDGNITK